MQKRSDHNSVDATPLPRIIGGMFGLEQPTNPESSAPPFLGRQSVFLLNGSSGISILAHALAPERVWLPSFLCDSMITAAGSAGSAIHFYAIDDKLQISSHDWLEHVKPHDLVVFVDYFGFPCDSRCAELAKGQGAWVLRDACQALLSQHADPFSDFVLFSPRKFVGVPDGGILVCSKTIDLGGLELERPPPEWWFKTLSASMLRHECDLHGGDRTWFRLFRESEAHAPVGFYAMSELSEMLLRYSINWAGIARKRVENFQALANTLEDIALFSDLPSGVVPLGFPVRLKNRDDVQQMLFEQDIYPSVHWRIHDAVPEAFAQSHLLAREIMTLVCDQRYGRDDMERVAKSIRHAMGR